jgi:release factor glutamine methyltransferase
VIAPVTARGEAVRLLRLAFERAGIETAALDARVLTCAALGVGPTDLLTARERPVGPAADLLADYASRRLAREPVARILGEREFWGLPFALSPRTLVPRPDTETVVETALALLPDSGCAASRFSISAPGPAACSWPCSTNAAAPSASAWIGRRERCRRRAPMRSATASARAQRFVAGSWAEALSGRFDLIVSNPPYIASEVIASLDADVREHDPMLALDGGPDGLDAYRALLADAPRLLAPGGHLVVEIGYDQAEALRELAGANGFAVVREARDLAGTPSVRRPESDMILMDKPRVPLQKLLVGPGRTR